jgi:hypothetical protein
VVKSLRCVRLQKKILVQKFFHVGLALMGVLPLSPKGGLCSHPNNGRNFMFQILLIKELNDEVSDTTKA